MTVNMDQLKERIEAHKHSEWTVRTSTLSGPEVWDSYNNHILTVEVGHAVWTCDDELDGCPEVSQEAVALAKLLVDLPDYALELIAAYEQARAMIRDLVEAENEAWEG